MTDDAKQEREGVLLPCPVPWCGSDAVRLSHFDANRRRHWVECSECNFKTPQQASRAKAVALWQTRAALEQSK